MEQRQMIILIDELAALLRVHPSTIRRWLADRRRGIGSFPLTVSSPGCKCRWLLSDIEAYIASQSQANAIPPVTPSARQVRRDQKEFQERQTAADKALLRHYRKPK